MAGRSIEGVLAARGCLNFPGGCACPQTDDVIGPAERAAALELLRQQKADRQIIFNRNGGHWVRAMHGAT